MMTMTTTTIMIVLEWSMMQLFMMEEKTLLLQSICPDYQPVLALQMLLQVLLLIFPLFLGMDWLLLQMKQWEYRDLWSVKLQLCNKPCCQCGINHRSIAQLFQDIKKEHLLWANHWLKRKGRISVTLVLSWFIMLSRKYSGCKSCSFCWRCE